MSTTVPYGTNVSAWDHLFEQIPPLQTWGRKFITVPLSTRHEDTYRILAAENNTMVRIGNNPPVTLQKGIYHEFSLLYTEPSLIESDKPILLAQFSNSNTVDRAWTSGDGDPFMVIVSPVNQTREKVSFVAYESPRINSKYFINVVVKDDAVGAIKLDNTIVVFNAVTGSGYSYAQVPLTKGNHYIESTVAGKGFIAYVYGFGGVEAYGYGVGYNLDIVLDLGSNINADGNKLLIRCEGSDSLVLSAGNAFDTYKWNTDATTSEIKISDAGWYKVEVATRSGCALKDSVELQISKPVVDLGIDHTVCNPEKDTLKAGDQFTAYSWSTTETSQKITISNSDKYSVVATNKYGCKARDSIIVSFVDKPKIDFSRIDTLICGQKSALLNISADKGVFSSQRLTDAFSFTGNNISVPEFGAYPFRIKATDEFSCFSDSLIHFGFRKTPTVDFSIDSTKCQGYNLDIQYLGDANISGSDFAWIFGGDTIVHGLGIDAYLVPLGVNRAKRDLKLTVTDEGCPNSKMIADIKVTPTLQLGIENNLGCEPLTSKLIANNTETVRYDWTFGDGSELNGPSSQPTHTYQNAGYYTVKLKVTTDKGCTNQVEIDSMVHVVPIPTVGFTQLPAQCLEIGNHQIGYSGTGDLQATYYWDLSGFDTEEVIANPGQTQGPFVFDLKNKPQANIGLRVTSKYGCQSDTAVLLVKRKPDLTINASILEACTPFSTTLTGSTTDPVDQVNYTWDFGDGKSGSNANTLHEYSSPGQTYDVGLTALSSLTGCSNTIVRKALIRTYPKPVASFSMDHNIVYNDLPDVAFTDKSIGATDYYWDFGDKTTSVLPSPLHHFVKMGHMKVLLEVANEYICTDTTSQNVLVAFDRLFPPNAFSPNSPNAVDREFKLGSEGMNTEGYYFRILTRWNDVVFEARNEFKGWNGQMANGSYAQPGVYLWLLEYSDFLGRRHKQTGTVTLIY